MNQQPTSRESDANNTFANPSQTMLDPIYKKIMWRIIPFIFVLWMLAWIDRVNVGFAKLQMQQDLGFSETVYGIGAGIFFLGYFFLEIPSNWLLLRIGARRTLARITLGWGTICVLMMLTYSPTYFYVMRFLLGAFEAGFQPGVLLYLTFWFPAHRRAKAFAWFISASAVSSVVGAPLAGAILNGMHGVNGWAGWQWLFLLEGVPTVLAGALAVWFLVDKPEQASWLSEQEKRLLQADLDTDRKSAGPREHSFLLAMRSPKLWLLTGIYFGIVAANATLSFFAPTIVRALGPTNPLHIGLLVGVMYIFGAIFQIAIGYSADKRREARVHCAIPVFVGACGLAGVGVFAGSNGVAAFLCLVVAVSGTMGAIPVFWQLPNAYLAGGAAAMGVAFINSVANLAGFGSPYLLGVVKDATGSFNVGLWIVAALEAFVALLIWWRLRRRETPAVAQAMA
ncbi:MAG: MFS transporter [Pandoraea sp.]|nr:MFS transporter [Pandoraea sp.]MDR3397412.1 MFS transporter [Pandoraea sp.]